MSSNVWDGTHCEHTTDVLYGAAARARRSGTTHAVDTCTRETLVSGLVLSSSSVHWSTTGGCPSVTIPRWQGACREPSAGCP